MYAVKTRKRRSLSLRLTLLPSLALLVRLLEFFVPTGASEVSPLAFLSRETRHARPSSISSQASAVAYADGSGGAASRLVSVVELGGSAQAAQAELLRLKSRLARAAGPESATREAAQASPPAQALPQAQTTRLDIKNDTSLSPDPNLSFTLPLFTAGEQPSVLILHTHGSESYSGTENSRSEDRSQNVVALGDQLALELEEAGIRVIHDRTLCDLPDFSGAYGRSLSIAEGYLSRYPSIELVLDLHRDSITTADGDAVKTACTVGGAQSAQIMLVVGTDEGGLEHPDWQENLTTAAALTWSLERLCPGVSRPVNLRSERFNQHLARGALIVELGSAANTLEEARLAASCLSEGVKTLFFGVS